jgi:menaquinone-dependent protoporphyrinogen oxidase
MKRILVAYATRAGSTREVAAYIGDELRRDGYVVDVLDARDVHNIDLYTTVILGSGIRAGHLLPEAVQFAKRFRSDLQSLPTAYFVVCMTMKDDTPQNRETVEGYLKPLIDIRTPFSTGLFAGVMDPERLGFIWRQLMRNVERGDYRKWDAIRAWANELVGVPTPQ